MARKIHPLELILRAHGTAELVNAREETLWASDADDDFREEFNEEFLEESDLDNILDFLVDHEIITESEADSFDLGEFKMSIETMDNSVNEPDDDEEDYDDE